MSSFKAFDIAGSGMPPSVRLNPTAQNIAQCRGESRRSTKVTKTAPSDIEAVARLDERAARKGGRRRGPRERPIYESTAPPSARYEQGNPLANDQGTYTRPLGKSVEEMVNMISASPRYPEQFVEVRNTSKEVMLATRRLGQG